VPVTPIMDQELDALERKLTTLIAHTRALRAANESLRREVAVVQERNRELAIRVQQASARLDALLSRIPAE
jgi:cell division protein ZapB